MRTVVVDKIASVTQACGLGNEVRVATDNIPAEEGVVVVVEILTNKSTYNTLELTSGRMAKVVKGDIVACVTQAANRDGAEFERRDELVFDRSPNRHAGFGIGPHRCLGVHLARRELKIGLRALHRRLPEYRLHPDRPPELFGGMKGVSSLWLVKG